MEAKTMFNDLRRSGLSRLFALSLGLELTILASLPNLGQAETVSKVAETNSSSIVFMENFDPPGDGEPKDTFGAGSRDGSRCEGDSAAFRPVMSARNYGLTLSDRPQVFVYVPETTAREVVLLFRDEAQQEYHRVFLPIAARSQVVGFQLPADRGSLSVGKNYQWSLAVVCGETLQPDDPVFSGWVQRVERTETIARQLAGKSTLERAQWYAQQGYWYDTIATLAQAKSELEPGEFDPIWQQFLNSVGLGAIATERLGEN
ncbi:DUF928 domain-containing protein [Oxynema sp. CENA135]|uniref:DUF928 domain-containing protein n=1 Tax=Oxynema sp. CENA135 TaxID=984206 RepID=UPI00351C7AA4